VYYTLIHNYEWVTENYQEYPRQILFKILPKTASIILPQHHASIEHIQLLTFSKEGGLDFKIHRQRVFNDFIKQHR
jgi:hypothetical protein